MRLVVAALIVQNGKLMACQRTASQTMPLKWEFPGGKVEPGEGDAEALRRELRERLDVDALIGDKLAERHTSYTDYDVEMVLYAATLDPGSPPRAVRVRDVKWVLSSEFERYPFPSADQKTMDALLDIKR